ncbi:3-hydroxyacyl-CoA dehydrogenase NAD-binding domain-containing protein [Comamonas sp. NLF-1-9]|uniref:3-hydroxyacyl-CoA dehydrogenase NAD-binding domain-containing protein n=1 Tax=Comamonas sp. NLF-1-9 TaxID=2853163 RepID=UPI001C45E830|nr:3-hydroxyacyl-CoA dehydrogenase NAD-binding domain-containing protein [Comamonas sp. NLF-1-9]QXL83510.1 enoyl-CoA hydratase/isomerase family protein [Comamonas sp. NLF-1-9]
MDTIRYELIPAQGEGQVALVTFDEPGSPVNTMCARWQGDLVALTAQVLADRDRLGAQLKGIVLASAKKTFFAGADLKALMRLTPADAPQVFTEIERMKKQMRTLETLGIPVVSCINGTALGGGWEVALMGHHRIAVDEAKTQLGLPEVTLGLLPGASGITKTVRLLGLMGAQPWLLEGKLFNPQQGKALGLVHALVATREELLPAALAWIAAHPESRQPWDEKGYKIPGGTPANPKIAAALAVAPAMLRKTTRGRYPAPEAALAAMVEGASVDFDTALRIESRYLAGLMTSPVAHNMVSAFFFDLNAIKSGQSRPKLAERFKPTRVGVLGAGMMGAGIAWAQASRDIATPLLDVSVEKAEHGKAYSARLADKRVEKGRMSAEAREALLACIAPTAEARDLAGCELIIEAVFENRELKARITREAEPQLAPRGFFASNTSTLPITGLAQASRAPEKFIGIHFFSPVDKMRLVEIIRGRQTSDETVARAYDYVLALGKLPIVVNDARGFYTSRTFGTYVMEGASMLAEGIPAPVIENAAMQAGMPVGPLAVLDETALSLSVHVMEQTRADLAAEGKTWQATPGELLVERMVKEFKRPGRAGGGGFYDYPKGEKKHLWSELKPLFEKPDTRWSVPELQDRLLYRQAIETARCLSEGVLTSVHDANIGSIFGIGFPAWTGGAMQFIYGTGVDAFAARAEELAQRHGAGFAIDAKVREAITQHQPVY